MTAHVQDLQTGEPCPRPEPLTQRTAGPKANSSRKLNCSWPNHGPINLQALDALAVNAAVPCWRGRAAARSESLAAESFQRLWVGSEQLTALCHISEIQAFAHVFSEAAASVLAKMVAITPSKEALASSTNSLISGNSTNPDVSTQKLGSSTKDLSSTVCGLSLLLRLLLPRHSKSFKPFSRQSKPPASVHNMLHANACQTSRENPGELPALTSREVRRL